MRILFLTGSRTDPPSRFRICQFAQPLAALGHDVMIRVPYPNRTWSSRSQVPLARHIHSLAGTMGRLASTVWNLRDAANYDVIMINRDLVPEPRISFLEPLLARRNRSLIFDFDDAIHLGRRERKLRHILPLFAWITPGNACLAEFARTVHKRVTVWPTVVNTDSYKPRDSRKPGPVRVGWSGSHSTAKHCLPLLESVLSELAKTTQFEFVVISNSDPQIHWKGLQVRYIPWTPQTEVSGLQEFDIGLMPLRDEPFERGKCGLKAIQYMAVGIPALVSPVGCNREIVLHGATGFHCATEQAWVEHTALLIRNAELRATMGGAGREHVDERYSVRSLLPTMISTFEKVKNLGRELA